MTKNIKIVIEILIVILLVIGFHLFLQWRYHSLEQQATYIGNEIAIKRSSFEKHNDFYSTTEYQTLAKKANEFSGFRDVMMPIGYTLLIAAVILYLGFILFSNVPILKGKFISTASISACLGFIGPLLL